MASDNIKGPKTSDAQIIGEMAVAAINANKPKLWSLSPKGGSDFGYDFEALIFANRDDGAQFYVNIQLKGTTQSNHLSADKTFISHAFNRRTLELWNVSGATCLVMVADFTETEDPTQAPIYFKLVNEELEELLLKIPQSQDQITLRIPTRNLYNRDIDIIPLIRPYLDELKAVRAELKRVKGPGVSNLSAEVSINSRNNELLFSHDGDSNDIKSLVEASPFAQLYTAQLTNLRMGYYEAVIQAIKSPSLSEIESDPIDAGVRAYLLSKAIDETPDKEQAFTLMKLAANLLKTNDEVLSGFYQFQFEKLKLTKEDEPNRDALLIELQPFSGPYVSTMKARLIAMSGNFELARKTLEGFSEEKVALTIPTISIIEKDWKRAIEEIERLSEIQTLQPKAKFWLLILKARAYFELALEKVKRPDEGQLYVPSFGLPEINLEILQQAYDCSFKAFKEAQKLNWPVNTEYALDVLAISSMVFEKIESNLPLITEFIIAKPQLTQARELISRLSIQYGSPKFVLKLAEESKDLPKFENEDLMVAVAMNASGNPLGAFKLMEEKDVFSTTVKNEYYFSSLVILGLAADATFQLQMLEKIRDELRANTLGQDGLALLNTSIEVSHSQLNKIQALLELKEYWLTNGCPYRIGLHILENLYPLDKSEAELAIEVAEIFIKENCLPSDQLLIYAHSLLTKGNHGKAIEVLDEATLRYPDASQIKSLLGIALEINGQSERAFNLIQEQLQDGNATNNARQYYCNIAIRMGFFEAAAVQMRTALAATTNKDTQISILESLIKLLFAMSNHHEELESLVWRYGTLVDQEDELQEGQFLQFYFVATSSKAITPSQERMATLQTRMDKYSSVFPNSRVIWRAEFPEDGSPTEMMDALQKAVGNTADTLKANAELERNLDIGKILVPFSWRPRRFLRNVSDVFTLWELNKRTSKDKQGYHLNLYTSDTTHEESTAIPQISEQSELVISLISMIVLNELGLLDLVLKTFNRVVIARNVLMRLQASRSLNASIIENQIATQIMEVLQRNFDRIIHPPMVPYDEADHSIPWYPEELEAMKLHGRVYMCDDIIESAMVCPIENKQFSKLRITTLDFLRWADHVKKILSPQDVAKHIGKMCDLNLGQVFVEQRYFVASIPRALQEASNETEEKIAFSQAETLNSILDGVWDFSKSFEEITQHFSVNLAYLMHPGNADFHVITSLWVRWLEFVRFKTDVELNTTTKIAYSFLRVLVYLPEDSELIKKLWSALWVVLKRCCSNEIKNPEDIEGVIIIANALGTIRGKEANNYQLSIGDIFSRALLGIDADTQIYKIFNDQYVAAVALSAIEDNKSKRK